jgi:hypothetical protein
VCSVRTKKHLCSVIVCPLMLLVSRQIDAGERFLSSSEMSLLPMTVNAATGSCDST